MELTKTQRILISMATRALDKQTPVWDTKQILTVIDDLAAQQGITLTILEKVPIVIEIGRRFGV
jgi:ABC-type methionine transport system ATPase subunit